MDNVDKPVHNLILVGFLVWKPFNGKKTSKSVDNVEMQPKPLVFKVISVDKPVDTVGRTYVFKKKHTGLNA